jgi:hypothetical protein
MPQINMEIPTGGTIVTPQEASPNSKLDMVNRCLRAIGESPLPPGTFLDALQYGTDAEVAKRIVEETMKEVQNMGWYFNTDYNFKLYKDEEGFITVPLSLLRMDTQDDNQYVLKGRRVYDMYNQTFVIEPEYIEADVIWLIDYELLPVEAFEYIAARAARKFAEDVVAAPELVEVNRTRELEAFTNLQRVQLQTQAYNMQNDRVSTRMHNGYLRRGLYRATTRR